MNYYQIAEYVGNIVAFKKYIDLVLKSIDDGDYNEMIVKKLSDNAELFFQNNNIKDDEDEFDVEEDKSLTKNEIFDQIFMKNKDDDDSDNFDIFQFKPKIIEKETDSSSDTTENESDIEFIDSDSSEDANPKKITYKDKLVDDFLNNNLQIDKYYYLKMNNINNKVNYYSY